MGTYKDRAKLSILEITKLFPDNEVAENWFIMNRWGDSISCPVCSSNKVSERTTEIRSWRCKDCRKDFSTKTGTLMQGSNLGFRVWALAIYLLTTHLKGIASTKLASDLSVTQKTAWHLSMRIRETFKDSMADLGGVVEVDEAYFGGLEKNKHRNKKLRAGRGSVGKAGVMGLKSRTTGKVKAFPIEKANKETLHGIINKNVSKQGTIYSDEWKGYKGLKNYNHLSVKHSVGEYVKGQAHTNGIESFWALLKRGYHGTHHHMSPKHIGRYVNEFASRHNDRRLHTIKQMGRIAKHLSGRQLRYKDLIA